jgi:hypothetical protein
MWALGQEPQRRIYEGTFVNTSANSKGVVRVEIAVGTSTVSGYINFSNIPGQPVQCSAGQFVGIKRSDQSMQIGFISSDPDPGCGYDKGWHMSIDAKLSADATKIDGAFEVVGQRGRFTAMRTK